MSIAPEYISGIAIFVVAILKLFKVDVGTEEITNLLVGLVGVIGGIIVIVKRFKQGDINAFGAIKK